VAAQLFDEGIMATEKSRPSRVSAFFYAGAGIFRRRQGGQSWWDFDGYDGFPPFLPIFVFEPLHVWDWHMHSTEADWTARTSVYIYRAIPIRWSEPLLVRTFLRAWLWLPLVTGLLFSMSCAHSLVARAAGFWLFILCGVAMAGLWLLNRRDQQIRLLLGRHRLGASDPVTWTDDLRALVAPPHTWFGAATFAEACQSLLAQDKVCEAMWAARLCAAIEDPLRGHELTETVLRAPIAQAELSRLRSLATPPSARPWPIVRKAEGGDAQFWYSHLFDGQIEVKEDIQYALHIGGLLAYSNEPLDEEEEKEWLKNPGPERIKRSGPHARRHFFTGLAIIAASLVGTYLFVKVANWFRLPTLADQILEEQRRQAQQR
jgi:hypothetical protein